ncbi:MAG: FAD-binding monooxygenase [Oceanospirillum sp.]|nr:FAD-binding monooxygenase [Oceanospirillum sp.]
MTAPLNAIPIEEGPVRPSAHFDVLIAGAGPAGCSAAITLAPRYRVALVDRSDQQTFRIGESLCPAGRRLLTKMDLWQDFLRQGHQACYGNRSIWGSDGVQETDFLRDPDGNGWHLDRARFDFWLRSHAVAKGSQLYSPYTVSDVKYQDDVWHVLLKSADDEITVTAKLLIDAAGRACPIARKLGAKRTATDKLVCGYLVGREVPQSTDAGFSYIEASPEGWWYSAPIPDDRRILAFFTDTGLPATQWALNPEGLIQHAYKQASLAALLDRCQFQATEESGYHAAHTSTLDTKYGNQWLATGDAAMSLDPLSSQGIFNGLYTGLYAALNADKWFSGQITDFRDYNQQLDNIETAYRQHYDEWYGLQKRWQDQPFWSARHKR